MFQLSTCENNNQNETLGVGRVGRMLLGGTVHTAMFLDWEMVREKAESLDNIRSLNKIKGFSPDLFDRIHLLQANDMGCVDKNVAFYVKI